MIYDAEDADGFERGIMGKDKPKVKRIYKITRVDQKNRLVHVCSLDAWGGLHDEVFSIHTIKALDKPIKR